MIRSILRGLVPAVLLLTLVIAGCANEFESNYVPEEVGTAYLPTLDVKVYGYSPEKLASLKAEGYRVIGISNFVGAPENAQSGMKRAAEQGKKVGAEIALYDYKFYDKTPGVKEVKSYQPAQTVTYEGRDGRRPYYGTATTQPTVTTAYVPITIERYTRKAIYLRKNP